MLESNNNTVEDMLYLAACAIHDIVPNMDRLKEMNIESLYRKSRFHNVTAIVCIALESGGILSEEKNNPELIKKWQDVKNKVIRKNMLLDAQRQQLFQFMEKRKIWYMPLKGSVLKDLYPKMGMRQMADNDILFDSKYQYELKDYMVRQGYEAKSVGEGNHDIYKKPPIYNFEMHTSLFDVKYNKIWFEYYKNVKDRLIKDEGNSYGYHFSDEDFYIYITTHTFKHYNGGGTGLRSLLDCYVYVWKKGDALNWEYIQAQLEKLGIASFEQKMRALSYKLFKDPRHFYETKLTKEEQEILDYLSHSGTYGTMQNRVEKKMKELQDDKKQISFKIKWEYCMRRLFPDMEWFKQHNTFCYQHKWIIPFFYIYRVVRSLCLRGKKVKKELEIVLSSDEK